VHCLPKDPVIFGFLTVELVTQVQIPIPAFLESEVYNIYHAGCTGKVHFRNQTSCNNLVWVSPAPEEMYGALRDRLPAKHIAVFKIRDYRSENLDRRLTGIRFTRAVNSGLLLDVNGLVRVHINKDGGCLL